MSFGGVNTFQQYSTDFGLGHNDVKVSFNYFDGLPESSLLNSLASNDLKLIFKLLFKRDETTKEKALTDLLKLLGDFSQNEHLFHDDIFSLCWSQLYPKLLLSDSKNIRIQSHQVTSKLIKNLNKRISKFLKDFIPLLLLGTCDLDSAVSKSASASLGDAFNKDSKKISALWILFHQEILNLVKEVILVEDAGTVCDDRYVGKDDSEIRFNRLFASAVSLLQILIKTDKDNINNYKETYSEILSSDSLWGLLSFKSTLFLKSYDIALQLLQQLYIESYLRTHKDVLKLSVRKLLKSLSQVNTKNVLKVAGIMIRILDTLTMLDQYKEGRIWSYDKTAKEKLFSFLSACCTYPHPGFFVSMHRFYERTAMHEFILCELEWFTLWEKSVKALNKRQFLGRFGADLLGECWTYYLKFVRQSGDKKIKDDVSLDILDTLRDNGTLQKLPGLVEALKDSLSPDFIVQQIQEALEAENFQASGYYLSNLVVLLVAETETNNSLHKLCDILFEAISRDFGHLSEKSSKVLELYQILINYDLQVISRELLHLMSQLPSWVRKDNYNILVGIVIDHSRLDATKKTEEYAHLLEKFFSSALNCGVSEANVLNSLDLLSSDALALLKESKVINEFLKDYVEGYNYTDDGNLFKSKLMNERVLAQVFQAAIRKDNIDLFCCAAIDLRLDLRKYLVEKTNFISTCMFKISQNTTQEAFQLFQPFIDHNTHVVKAFSRAIVQHAQNKPPADDDTSYIEYASQLIRSSRENASFFFPMQLQKMFLESVPFIDYRLAPLNCLQLMTHLLPASNTALNLETVKKLLNYGVFMDTLCCEIPDLLTEELAIFLSMISELGEDYNSLSDEPQEEFNDIKNTILKSKSYKVSFDLIFKRLIEPSKLDEGDTSTFDLLFRESAPPVIAFYKFRIIYKLLLNEVDCLMASAITSYISPIERYITDVVRSKNTDEFGALGAAVILRAMQTLGSGESFTKLRNLLASECIGAKETDIYGNCLKAIIFLNIFFTEAATEESSLLVAPQRLSMMIKSIEGWLDSEIPYDSDFIVVRIALLQLFSSMTADKTVSETIPSMVTVIVKLLVDSLSLCHLEDTGYLLELRVHCLKLYQSLSKLGVSLIPEESKNDIFTCLVELCLTNFPSDTNNQVSVIFYRALHGIMMRQSVEGLLDYYDSFLESFLTSGVKDNFNQVRLLACILQKVIQEKQQVAVVEYELKKQQEQRGRNDETTDIQEFEDQDSFDLEFKLPQPLVEKLVKDAPSDYFEYENQHFFLKYLWYWDLALQFFDSSSYNLRQLFIDQLRAQDLIEKFFNFLTDQIELNETKFWDSAGAGWIVDYDAAGEEFSPYKEDLMTECRRLLVHDLYRMFDNVGSLSTSWWLNIKDRSYQSKIEKFVSRFISPILIQHELDRVATKIDTLTSKDDALSIKINKVTNEVKASYLIDEQKLELSFRMPNNYPLTNIEVVGISRVGISEQKWKQWIMSTQRVITGMNGSVVDSLELFTKNVNLQFSGFEECAICYSILHAVDRKLPTKTCPTCNNKFHGACLYKWFRSSGNNTCPLCRSVIPFRK